MRSYPSLRQGSVEGSKEFLRASSLRYSSQERSAAHLRPSLTQYRECRFQNSAATMSPTTRSGQLRPLPHTPAAASNTPMLEMTSLREHSNVLRIFTSANEAAINGASGLMSARYFRTASSTIHTPNARMMTPYATAARSPCACSYASVKGFMMRRAAQPCLCLTEANRMAHVWDGSLGATLSGDAIR